MTDIKLYFAPDTCARVPMICLEEIGEPFSTHLVRFMKGEHKSLDYKNVNPKGKVPTLLVNGEALTENVAIIRFLNDLNPEAKLLPIPATRLDEHRQTADLCFCSATLHPIVTRIRLPSFMATPDSARSVWETACAAMQEPFQLIEDRLATGPWWYGDQWSAMDAYLYWVHWRVEGAEFDVTPFPNYADHAKRMLARPAVQRALAREAEAKQILEAEGISFVPPPIPE